MSSISILWLIAHQVLEGGGPPRSGQTAVSTASKMSDASHYPQHEILGNKVFAPFVGIIVHQAAKQQSCPQH